MYTRDSSFFFVSHLSQTLFPLQVEVPHLLIPAAIWVGAGGRGGEGGDRLAEGEKENRSLLLLQTLVAGGIMSLQPRRVCASLVLGRRRRVCRRRRTCCAGRRCPQVKERVVCRPLLLPIPSGFARRRGKGLLASWWRCCVIILWWWLARNPGEGASVGRAAYLVDWASSWKGGFVAGLEEKRKSPKVHPELCEGS